MLFVLLVFVLLMTAYVEYNCPARPRFEPVRKYCKK